MNSLHIKIDIANTIGEKQWVELHNKLEAEIHRFLFSLVTQNKVIPTRKEIHAIEEVHSQGLQSQAEMCHN